MRDLDSWLLFCRWYVLRGADAPQDETDDVGCTCAQLLHHDDVTP